MEEKDLGMPRSRSLAIIKENMSTTRKQSDPFVQQVTTQATPLTPIHEAQSYKLADQCPIADKAELIGVKRLLETLLEPEHSTPSRHSAASLKVHFRSLDDISNEDEADETVQEFANEASAAFQRKRNDSEGTSWSVSESDITGNMVVEEDAEDVDGESTAPDGGWGWVVVIASFMIHLIADGATFSFGVIYVELLQYFKESRGYTAWIGGLFMAMPLLSGPLASSLADRYGCRAVTIVGSVLAAIGFVLSSISNSLELLFFTFGIISGFGLSLCYVAAILIVAYYFDKRRSLATGLAVCGSGIGTFIFAPLTQYLIEEYGWRGTTLIIAGLFLNISVCGAVMRDIEGSPSGGGGGGSSTSTNRKKMFRSTSTISTGRRSRQCSESQFCPTPDKMEDLPVDFTEAIMDVKFDIQSDVESNNEDGADVRLCNSLISLPTFLGHADKIPHEVLMTITNNPRLYSIVLHNYPTLFANCNLTDEHKEHIAKVDNHQTDQTSPAANQLLAPDLNNRTHHHHWNTAYLKGLRVKKRSLTYRGAMLNLPRYRLRASSCPDIYRNSIITIAREKEGACWDYIEELRQVLMDMFDTSFLANPRYILFAISNVLLYSSYHVPYVYMADWAIAQGHPEEDASFLLSVVGILNTLGEVILGYLGDRSWVNPTWVYTGSMVVCGLSTAAVPLVPNYTWLATASGLFGLSIAANYSLTSVILVDLISLERFVNAYGLLLLFQGVANLVGPPIAGWIRDVTGSYDPSFYIAGVFIMLSGIIFFSIPLVQHIRLRIANKSATDHHLPPAQQKDHLSQSSRANNV